MIRRLIVSTLLLLLCFVAMPVFAAADNPAFPAVCGGKQTDSTVCKESTKTANPVSGSDGIIMKAVTIIGYLAGAAAVLIIILGSFRFITSHGDPANVKKAKDSIFYAVIGLVIIVLAEAIIRFVLGKL